MVHGTTPNSVFKLLEFSVKFPPHLSRAFILTVCILQFCFFFFVCFNLTTFIRLLFILFNLKFDYIQNICMALQCTENKLRLIFPRASVASNWFSISFVPFYFCNLSYNIASHHFFFIYVKVELFRIYSV